MALGYLGRPYPIVGHQRISPADIGFARSDMNQAFVHQGAAYTNWWHAHALPIGERSGLPEVIEALCHVDMRQAETSKKAPRHQKLILSSRIHFLYSVCMRSIPKQCTSPTG